MLGLELSPVDVRSAVLSRLSPGLAARVPRKKQSSNEDHQDAEECCDQIHRCPSDGLFLLFARIAHGPTKIWSSCIKKNSSCDTERFVLCQHLQLGSNATSAASNLLAEKRPSLLVMHCSRPNQYVYCRWETRGN